MYRYYWCLPFGFLAGTLAVVAVLTSAASFHFTHPRYPHLKFNVTSDGQVVLNQSVGLQPIMGNGTPRLRLDSTDYDFGILPPGSDGTHIFRIRNDGTGNLFLKRHSSSCRCTLAHLPSGVILPQDEGEVHVVWRIPEYQNLGDYQEQVTLLTNDPDYPLITLRVRGQVQRICWTDPEEIVLTDILPDENRVVSVPIKSHTWRSIHAVAIQWQPQIPGVECRFEPVPAGSSEGNVVGHLIVHTTQDLAVGYFTSTLRMSLTADDDTTSYHCDVSVSGNRLGRFSLAGPGLDATGNCDLGKVERGKRLERTFTLRVRDHRIRSPDDLVIHVSTDCLHVSLEPISTTTEAHGLFRLRLVVPDTTPNCNYLGPHPAVVSIRNAHAPREKGLAFNVYFAVVSP